MFVSYSCSYGKEITKNHEMLFSRSHSCHGHQILRSLLSSLNLIILKPCHRVSLKEAGWLLGLYRWLFDTKLKVICLDFYLNVSACYLKLLTVSSSSNTVSKSIKALHAHVITATTLGDTVAPPPPPPQIHSLCYQNSWSQHYKLCSKTSIKPSPINQFPEIFFPYLPVL